jgi:hypothetical protein
VSELLGALGGASVGIAVGEAGATILEPALEAPRQKAWQDSQAKILELPELAALVAQALNELGDVVEDAARNGYDEDALRSAIQLALHGPGVAEALTLYRRNGLVEPSQQITLTQLEHALAKAGLEGQYWEAIKAQVNLPLEGAQLAQGIHRGYIAYSAPGFIAPPDTPGDVPFYPQTNIDAAATAAANGMDAQQLQVLVGIAGLPLSLFEMLELLNRGLVTEDDVKRAIANSNLQNQYMDVALDLRRRLLTPHEYAELDLRGYLSHDDRDAGAALSGMTPADTELLYNVLGRSVAVHQVTTGLARGGAYPGSYSNVPEPYRSAIERSNIREEYSELAYANRYTIPSYFVLKPLTASGAITVDECTQYLLDEGYPPELATKAAQSFAAGTSTTAKAPTVSQLSTQYRAGKLTTAQFTSELQALGYSSAAAVKVIASVDAEPVSRAVTTNIGKLRSGFVGGAIDVDQATTALAAEPISSTTASGLLAAWERERAIEQLGVPTPPAGPT